MRSAPSAARLLLLRGILLMLPVGDTACASTGPTPEPVGADDAQLEGAAARAREVIKEGYAAIRRGSVDGLVTLLSEQAFVIGPGPRDVFTSRSDAVVALQAVLRGTRKHKLVSRGLVVVASPSGKAAWATDSVQLDGQTLRALFVLEEADELWSVTAVHVAFDVPAKRLASLAPTLPDLVELPGDVDPGARDVAGYAGDAAARPEKWAEQLTDRPVATVLGSGAREVTRGAKKIRRLWQGKKRKVGRPPPSIEVLGAVQAGAASDGSLAWVVLNGKASEDGQVEWPTRLFAIYERDAEGWRLVLLQLAVAPRP